MQSTVISAVINKRKDILVTVIQTPHTRYKVTTNYWSLATHDWEPRPNSLPFLELTEDEAIAASNHLLNTL